MLISISGSSGVGKTTLAQLICAVVGSDSCLQISGDDLHRWERSDPMWDVYTHLNPDSNDLHMGLIHLRDLKDKKSVQRRRYNHETGKFDPPITLEPKPVMVYEGLHAFYDAETSELADVRIYVDTDSELKTEWKLKRDTKKRGYTKNQVLTTMERRKADEESFISPQKDRADIVVKFIKNRNRNVLMEYVCVTSRGSDLIRLVKDFYDSLVEFLDVCKWLSLEPSLVQGRGGNVSVKCESGLIVTASGSMMSDVNMSSGYCVCDPINRCTTYANEASYTRILREKVRYGYGRPSMETGFHANMNNRVVVHTHPLHVNAILCSGEAEQVVASIFKDLSYEFVPYFTPGFELVNNMKYDCEVLFLQNHGVVVGASSAEDAIELTEKINNRCKRWLGSHVESFVETESIQSSLPLFPDAAVFEEEMFPTNAYILHLLQGACLTPRYLCDNDVFKLLQLTSEIYRKSLHHESKRESVS